MVDNYNQQYREDPRRLYKQRTYTGVAGYEVRLTVGEEETMETLKEYAERLGIRIPCPGCVSAKIAYEDGRMNELGRRHYEIGHPQARPVDRCA